MKREAKGKKMERKDVGIPIERIEKSIFLVRGQKVMLDRDLAILYGVKTKALKQAVRRNIKRFPDDFMFELSKDEFQNWRSQIVTSNRDKMGLRYSPMAFTEQGVAMFTPLNECPVKCEAYLTGAVISAQQRKGNCWEPKISQKSESALR